MMVKALTTNGIAPLALDERERSVAARHVNAATHYRDTGQVDRLTQFTGVTVGGHELETRPEEIERLAVIGQLDFEDFYENG